MSDYVMFLCGQGLITLLSVFFAFKLGRAKEREKYESEKSKNAVRAAKLRLSLRRPGVVKRLQDKYGR